MNLHVVWALVGCALLLGCGGDSDDASKLQDTYPNWLPCTRHIYNNSNCPWTFKASPTAGKVYFGDGSLPESTCQRLNGPCTVPPHTTITVTYDFDVVVAIPTSSGVLFIEDQNHKENHWEYHGIMGACPKIKHSGNTGAVALNDPANGDLNAWGQCTW